MRPISECSFDVRGRAELWVYYTRNPTCGTVGRALCNKCNGYIRVEKPFSTLLKMTKTIDSTYSNLKKERTDCDLKKVNKLSRKTRSKEVGRNEYVCVCAPMALPNVVNTAICAGPTLICFWKVSAAQTLYICAMLCRTDCFAPKFVRCLLEFCSEFVKFCFHLFHSRFKLSSWYLPENLFSWFFFHLHMLSVPLSLRKPVGLTCKMLTPRSCPASLDDGWLDGHAKKSYWRKCQKFTETI